MLVPEILQRLQSRRPRSALAVPNVKSHRLSIALTGTPLVFALGRDLLEGPVCSEIPSAGVRHGLTYRRRLCLINSMQRLGAAQPQRDWTLILLIFCPGLDPLFSGAARTNEMHKIFVFVSNHCCGWHAFSQQESSEHLIHFTFGNRCPERRLHSATAAL